MKKKRTNPTRRSLFSGRKKPARNIPRIKAVPVSKKFLALSTKGVNVMSKKALEEKQLSSQKPIQRFASLSTANKHDIAIIQKLAEQYAKIFNAGFVVKTVGIETYFLEPSGKERFCFANLEKIHKTSGSIDTKTKNPAKIVKEMANFYQSISMNDHKARTLFVKKFMKGLNSNLHGILRHAIMLDGELTLS